MSDVALNRETCYHCDRPIRWKQSDEVCKECHDKWGEPEMEADDDDIDDENSDGVIIDAGDAVMRTNKSINCPNCPGWKLLKSKDDGYFCRNCHEEFTANEIDT